MKQLWTYWARALGDKTGPTNKDADITALIRTLIILQAIVTNIAIMAGVIHHW